MPSCLSAMRRASLLAMGAALAEPANASVHAVHPDRPLRLMVPFPTGGGAKNRRAPGCEQRLRAAASTRHGVPVWLTPRASGD
jgi:hypothetical protein